jgi:hypothetical protein
VLGFTKPAQMRSSVVLPQPLAPTDGGDLAAPHRQVDAAEHHPPPVPLAHAAQRQQHPARPRRAPGELRDPQVAQLPR